MLITSLSFGLRGPNYTEISSLLILVLGRPRPGRMERGGEEEGGRVWGNGHGLFKSEEHEDKRNRHRIIRFAGWQ